MKNRRALWTPLVGLCPLVKEEESMSDEMSAKDLDLFRRAQGLTQAMVDAERNTIPSRTLTREILDEQALSTYIANRDKPEFLERLGLKPGNIIDQVLEKEQMLIEQGMNIEDARNFFDDETFMNLLEEEMRQGKAEKGSERAD